MCKAMKINQAHSMEWTESEGSGRFQQSNFMGYRYGLGFGLGFGLELWQVLRLGLVRVRISLGLGLRLS